MRWIVGFILLFIVTSGAVKAQDTATPEPTPTETPLPTFTPTPEPYVYATVMPPEGTPDGQMTRFDYVATAGDVHIANLLTWLLYSVWALFLFVVIVLIVYVRRK